MHASPHKSPHSHIFSKNWQLAAVLGKSHIIFNMIYWRCDLNLLLNHLTIKSLPYWSAKGLLLLQKVVWFWSFFGKNLYTFNSITPVNVGLGGWRLETRNGECICNSVLNTLCLGLEWSGVIYQCSISFLLSIEFSVHQSSAAELCIVFG